MIGSHIDTVPNGGKYDGLTGVIAALEVLRVVEENDITLNNPIELVVFAEEEGSNFGTTMVGNKYISNKIGLEDLKSLYTDSDETAYDFIQSKGFNFKERNDFPIDKNKDLSMIELHVEQGGVLDKEGMDIGVVEAIAGMNSVKVTLDGKSNHAGTTPMSMRRDPLLAASEIIYKIPDMLDENGSSVATVGKITSIPNATNVISSSVTFFIDIRDVVQENIEKITNKINDLCVFVAGKNNVQASIELVGSSKVVKMNKKLVKTLENEAQKEGMKYKKMN